MKIVVVKKDKELVGIFYKESTFDAKQLAIESLELSYIRFDKVKYTVTTDGITITMTVEFTASSGKQGKDVFTISIEEAYETITHL